MSSTLIMTLREKSDFIKRITFKVEIFAILTLANFQNFARFRENLKLNLKSFPMLLIICAFYPAHKFNTSQILSLNRVYLLVK